MIKLHSTVNKHPGLVPLPPHAPPGPMGPLYPPPGPYPPYMIPPRGGPDPFLAMRGPPPPHLVPHAGMMPMRMPPGGPRPMVRLGVTPRLSHPSGSLGTRLGMSLTLHNLMCLWATRVLMCQFQSS